MGRILGLLIVLLVIVPVDAQSDCSPTERDAVATWLFGSDVTSGYAVIEDQIAEGNYGLPLLIDITNLQVQFHENVVPLLPDCPLSDDLIDAFDAHTDKLLIAFSIAFLVDDHPDLIAALQIQLEWLDATDLTYQALVDDILSVFQR